MSRRVKWLFSLAVVWLALWAGDRVMGGRGVAAAEPDRFTADLAVRRGVLKDGSAAIEWTPERQYRIERDRTPRAWRTTLRIVDDSGKRPPAAVGAATDIVAVVDSGDDDPLLFVDRAGRVRPGADLPRRDDVIDDGRRRQGDVPQVTRRRATGFDWLEGVVQSTTARDRRARAAFASLGPVRGRVRGLDQYVAVEQGIRREVLMDPAAVVPVEMSVSRGDRTESRTFFTYEPDGRGNLLRTRFQRQRRPDDAAETSVIDVKFTNVRLPKGGAR